MSFNITNINKLFYSFLVVHLILWTLVPTLTNNNLPLDTIEVLAWGSNLDWGFGKHPPASAFFSEVFLVSVLGFFVLVTFFVLDFFEILGIYINFSCRSIFSN